MLRREIQAVSEHLHSNKNMKRKKISTIPKDVNMENTITALKCHFSQNYLQLCRKFQDRYNSHLQMATAIWKTW